MLLQALGNESVHKGNQLITFKKRICISALIIHATNYITCAATSLSTPFAFLKEQDEEKGIY